MPKYERLKSIRIMVLAHASRLIVSALTPLVTLPYVTRILGPEALGLYEYSLALVSNFLILGIFGLSSFGQREIAAVRHIPDAIGVRATNLYCIGIASAAGSYLILMLFALSGSHSVAEINMLLILGLTIPAYAISAEWILLGLDEYFYVSIRTIFLQLISLVSIFTFVKGSGDAKIYAILTVAPQLATAILNSRKIYQFLELRSITKKHLIPDLKKSSLFLLSSLAISVYTSLDTIILGRYGDHSELGIYALSKRISLAGITGSTALGTVLVSKLTSLNAKGQQQQETILLQKSLLFLLFLSLPASLGLMLLSRDVVLIFGGERYLASNTSLLILSANVFIVSLAHISLNQILIPSNKETYALRSWLFGAICGSLLGALLIPRFGNIGAALTCTISEFCVLVIAAFYARDKILACFDMSAALVAVLSCFVMGMFIYFINDYYQNITIVNLVQKIVFSIAVFVCATFLLSRIMRKITNGKSNGKVFR